MTTTSRHIARPLALALLLAGSAALPALAEGYAQGDFTLGLGVHDVMPKDKPGKLAGADSDISDSLRPTITFEYFLRDNIGIEVLGALPFSHDVKLDGLGKVAKVKQLPPVISLQYYFANDSKFTPFVGAGINYTAFIEDKGAGALAGSDVDVKDSWGLALHGGVDYALDANNALRLDARWIDINSKVYLNDTYIGKADISPWVFGAAWVHRF